MKQELHAAKEAHVDRYCQPIEHQETIQNDFDVTSAII